VEKHSFQAHEQNDRQTRNPQSEGAYSASGVHGDVTLATHEKGELLVRIAVAGILKEIEEFRRGN
jgi:creatinine amidohydrolase/Fe(II)-dependent formamide hydrolase-like protein